MCPGNGIAYFYAINCMWNEFVGGGLLVVGWIDVYRVDLNRFKLNKKNINNFN